MTGASFGVIAAVLLGTNTILVAVAARRWGVWRTTASSLIIAYGVMIVYAFATGVDFPMDAGGLWPFMSILGFAAVSSYFASNHGLKLGPVSVVSPIGSTTGVMTVVFAFAFLGERPGLIQWLGIPLAGLGVVLLSVEVDETGERHLIGWGPVFAFIGVVTGAVSNAGLRIPAREIGPVQTAIAQRTFTVFYVLVALAFFVRKFEEDPEAQKLRRWHVRTGHESDARLGLTTWLLLIVIGILDALAFIMFAEGLAIEDAWLIGLLSQSGRIIAVGGGYVLFQERLGRTQWIGLALALAGLTLVVVAGK
jgi:uncharacterized membrane protein